MWFYVTPSREKAEIPDNDIAAAARSGLVAPQTLVWEEGMAEWQPAGQVRPDLFAAPAPASPSVPAPPPTVGSAVPPPPPGVRPTPGIAVASFVCGLVGIVLGLGILTGLPAVVLGHMAMKLYRREPDRYGGRGLAIAGLVLGYISIVLTFLVVLLFVLLAAGGIAAGVAAPH